MQLNKMQCNSLIPLVLGARDYCDNYITRTRTLCKTKSNYFQSVRNKEDTRTCNR